VKLAVSVSDLSEVGKKQVSDLVNADVDLICIETLHTYYPPALDFIKKIKKDDPNVELGASAIVTKEATQALISAGVDSLRVGIGGGSHCTTRLVTGVGRPQLSTVKECVEVAKEHNVPIISESGIRYAGDIMKAIAFGAESVMIGGMLSATDECPGEIIKKNGKYYKHTWGMCTIEALNHEQPWKKRWANSLKQLRAKMVEIALNKPHVVDRGFEEGVARLVPYKGSVEPIINLLVSGVRRSMWYLGAKNLEDVMEKSQIITVTSNTRADSAPRI